MSSHSECPDNLIMQAENDVEIALDTLMDAMLGTLGRETRAVELGNEDTRPPGDLIFGR